MLRRIFLSAGEGSSVECIGFDQDNIQWPGSFVKREGSLSYCHLPCHCVNTLSYCKDLSVLGSNKYLSFPEVGDRENRQLSGYERWHQSGPIAGQWRHLVNILRQREPHWFNKYSLHSLPFRLQLFKYSTPAQPPHPQQDKGDSEPRQWCCSEFPTQRAQ